MSLTPFVIAGYESGGLEQDKKPFLLPDKAFQELQNAYVWRDRVKKREGIKLVGRLQRSFEEYSFFNSSASPWTFNILKKSGYIKFATRENPGKITTTYPHGLVNGDSIVISGVSGMTNLNGNTYVITVSSTTSFTIGVDTTGYNAYLSGGHWISDRSLIGDEPNAEIAPGTFLMSLGAISVSDYIKSGSVTGATNANPCVITSVSHHLTTGDSVTFAGVGGMVNLNTGSYTVTVLSANTFSLDFTDSRLFPIYTVGGTWSAPSAQGNGTIGSATAGNFGTINYLTGSVTLTHTAGVGAATLLYFGYYPSFPVMGIIQREVVGINDEETLFFDTKYCYVASGTTFHEFIPGTIWTGTDAQFFWGTNYRGSNPSDRLFFVTNFNIDPYDPIRYTDGVTWTDFRPALAGTTVLAEALGLTAGAGLTFNGTLATFPVEPGTVTITVGAVTFSDVTTKNGILVGNPNTNVGILNYETGVFTLSFSPAVGAGVAVTANYVHATNTLYQTRLLEPYFGRLCALNVYEGANLATAQANNIFMRARFSQVGNPIQSTTPASPQLVNGAWRTDVFGKGGFIDAPVNEIIVSSAFYKNTLIVGFERSMWQLRYVGDYGLPYLWERISSDFGTESTFSTTLFDSGVLAAGDKAFTASTANTVQRIDNQIPDLIFSVRNAQDGPERVHGIRDFQRELVFWNYSDSEFQKKFPNTVLVYNYKNNTFAQFRDNVTAFGTLQLLENITWDRTDIFWDDEEVFWDDIDSQSKFPSIVIGNQEGFIHYYGYTSIDEPSLNVSGIDLTTDPVELTVINHNFEDDEFVILSGLQFLSSGEPVGSVLNDIIYQVLVIDNDTIGLTRLGANVTSTSTDTYIGGGRLTLLPRLYVQTKDFNPYAQQALQLKLAYIDFLTDCTPSAIMSVQLFLNASQVVQGNLLVGNKEVETYMQNPYYTTNTNNDPVSQYSWHRFFATCTGQFVNIVMTFDDDTMYLPETHQQDWTLNAMTMYMRPGGKNVF